MVEYDLFDVFINVINIVLDLDGGNYCLFVLVGYCLYCLLFVFII